MSNTCEAFYRKFVFWGFISLILCLAPTISNAIPVETFVSPSVATPLASSKLVASASNKDDGLTPGEPPKLEDTDGKKTDLPEGAGVPEKPEVAYEVVDMMKDPYHNLTISTSDRDEVAIVDSETDTVDDPHVKRNNKTHEEEEKPTSSPATASTQQAADEASATVVSSDVPTSESATEHSTLPVSSTASSIEGSVYSIQDAETVETIHGGEVATEMKMEQMKSSEPDEKLTPPPVSALVSHDTHDHSTNGKSSSLSHTTEAAAILAGVLVLVALAGYLGLLFWRRLLENRYGNREMLVNEDDDFKHFEL